MKKLYHLPSLFFVGLIAIPLPTSLYATSLSLKVPPQTTTHEIMPYCDTLCELDYKNSVGIIDNGMLQTGKRKVTCACS